MARQSSIWKRKQDGWFCTTFRGVQVKLAQDGKVAQRAFHALHAEPKEMRVAEGFRPTFRAAAHDVTRP